MAFNAYQNTFEHSQVAGEDPANDIVTFHLWFSSNNIMDDFI
jgi:hypothetical protein